jgi:hypothetical protein
MTDNFEKAMQDIALNSAANGGPTIQDVLTAMVAGNLDAEHTADKLHTETLKLAEILRSEISTLEKNRTREAERRHKETMNILSAHCAEADFRDTEIHELQEWRRNSAESCQRRIEKIVKAEHKICHDEHLAESHANEKRRFDDPVETDFLALREKPSKEFDLGLPIQQLRDMTTGWRVLRWLIVVLAGALLVWGMTFWADSCSRKQYWGDTPPTLVETPSPSSTSIP